MHEEITHLRREIRLADDELQRLVRKRLELARKIGEVKREGGLPLRDFAAEREVIDRWRVGLSPVGVTEDRADDLARWLVEEALRIQENLGERDRIDPSPTDILVVGGAGQMGAWVAEFLRASGHRVGVLDPKAGERTPAHFVVKTDLARAAQDADVVVVATPMRIAPAVYKELWSSETEATVFDILSIKAPIIPLIRKGVAKGFHVGSAHPLFGPQSRALSGRNFLVLDCGDPLTNRRIVSLFSRSSLRISTLPLEVHDPLMAEVLALPHAVSLIFALALRRGAPLTQSLATLAPTSFHRQAEIARVVTHENPELSFDIQALNPFSEALYEKLERAVKQLRGAARGREMSTYRGMVEGARGLLDRESDASFNAPPVSTAAPRATPPPGGR